jgi:hypothetical protein
VNTEGASVSSGSVNGGEESSGWWRRKWCEEEMVKEESSGWWFGRPNIHASIASLGDPAGPVMLQLALPPFNTTHRAE